MIKNPPVIEARQPISKGLRTMDPMFCKQMFIALNICLGGRPRPRAEPAFIIPQNTQSEEKRLRARQPGRGTIEAYLVIRQSE